MRTQKVNYSLYEEDDFMKDCPRYTFNPTVLPAVPRIIAIGDIHGDYTLAIESLKLAKVINHNLDWVAQPPNTVLVQVGDLVDSCRPYPGHNCRDVRYPIDSSDDMKILELFENLDYKARKVGGAVFSLLGNHELMNSQGNFNYVSYDNYHNFDYTIDGVRYTGPEGRREVFRPSGPVAKKMACRMPSVLVIGSTMFTHAGVLPSLANKINKLPFDGKTKLKYLNHLVRKWLLNKLSEIDIDKANFVIESDNSPFWTRIFGRIPKNSELNSKTCMDSVKETLNVYQVGHLVVGHTPQMFTNSDGINGTCYVDNDNKLYRIDGGFSKAFINFNSGEIVQILEIIDDSKFRIISKKL